MRKLNDRELGTVLAALRVYQQRLEENGGAPPQDVDDIATAGGTIKNPMVVDEIDSLCEKLNIEDQPSLHDKVVALVDSLDAIGFANGDAPVSGADAVDAILEHLPGLREGIRG